MRTDPRHHAGGEVDRGNRSTGAGGGQRRDTGAGRDVEHLR